VIAFLRGKLLAKQPSRVIVDVHGVGYDLSVPLSTFYETGDPGSEISLRVHTHVREDTLALFGFATDLELQIFERLLGVSGIGPKVALAVLSGIEPPDLIRAVRAADIARLTAIPGVGRKTAERIALELKDRLPQVLPEDVRPASEPTDPDAALKGDVLSALVNLGYHQSLAEKAVERALKGSHERAFQMVLKNALRELAK
jgi:holliday junction DNA helicase RuvA